MTDYVIRDAVPADAALLAGFNRAMALETESRDLAPGVVEAGVRAVFEADGHGFYLVAESAGEVIGALMVTFEWSDWRNGRFWWIQSVYVQPGHRRNGVFRRLYRHARDRARASGDACGLRLYVDRGNGGAQRTYGSLGMSETGYLLYEEEFGD